MKQRVLLCIGVCIILGGCDVQRNDIANDSVISEADDNKIISPFLVAIDKTAIETRKEKETTVFIVTELEDWDFTVSTQYGKISNIGKNSFDYIAPEDEEILEDAITIFLTDKDSGISYNWNIPIMFSSTKIAEGM